MAFHALPMSIPPTPETASQGSKQISEFELRRPPSCIQFVPEPQYANHLVVGTYQLEPDEVGLELTDAGSKESPAALGELGPKEQYRNGSLSLLKYTDNQLSIIDTIECTSAVYDLHFLPGTTTTFAAASSTGTISFYHVVDTLRYSKGIGNISETRIQPLFAAQVLSPTTIITFFEFVHAQSDRFGPLIVATANDGGVYLMNYCLENFTIDLLNDGKPITEHKLKFLNTPDYAWCCASYFKETFSVYSGGDGGDLVRERIPIFNGKLQINERFTQVHKYHDAGVTAILPLPSSKNDNAALILTGSYDEYVRLYSIKENKVLANLKLGGGVYRLKFVRQFHWPTGKASYTILACCMHAGTKVLQVQGYPFGDWTIDAVASLNVPGNNADNYCYAADVRPQGQMLVKSPYRTYSRLCVSGTFVDKKLAVWEFTIDLPKD
ncbi:hypothetical protein BKA65DRAFT_416739 [Rhexocercosporidium sp. MPI-PUGE-AT-0058]|nr:hypothetical protein BKA65DRAFT_416739 [Rhexocercosporidium sp. MPI-PUGE-AT-0058]